MFMLTASVVLVPLEMVHALPQHNADIPVILNHLLEDPLLRIL